MKSDDTLKKTEFISVRISKATKKKLEKLAKEKERSLSWLVSKIIETHIG